MCHVALSFTHEVGCYLNLSGTWEVHFPLFTHGLSVLPEAFSVWEGVCSHFILHVELDVTSNSHYVW
jgi:hypothetical protein